jgi:deazaflavin-dependent oxidoreductase (nitroreductase family)
MNGNEFITWLLRSPFHGMLSDGMMLITITGRKTGKKFTTPVGYYREGDYLWVLSSRDRMWWKNLRGGAEVGLLLKRKSVAATAELVLDEKAVEARMFDYLHHVPMAGKPMGVRMINGQPNQEDIARTAQDRLFVRLRLMPK